MQNSLTVSLTSGTPIRLANVPTYARSLIITMLAGGTGRGYVLSCPTDIPAVKSAQTLIMELAPATATSPGGQFYWDRSGAGSPGINVQEFAVDGFHTGDLAQCSWELP